MDNGWFEPAIGNPSYLTLADFFFHYTVVPRLATDELNKQSQTLTQYATQIIKVT